VSTRNDGVTADPLFLGVTRPAMAFGVTYSALLFNAVVTVELFLLTRNLLWLLACLPVHGLFWLLCLSEPRFFDLALLWGKTRGPGLFGNGRVWRAQGYSALPLDLPSTSGQRRALPTCLIADRPVRGRVPV
jgi:type IV secretion system protein VirB3